MMITQVNYPHIFDALETIMTDGGDAPYQETYVISDDWAWAPVLLTVSEAIANLEDEDLAVFLTGEESEVLEIANRSPQLMTAHRFFDHFLNGLKES